MKQYVTVGLTVAAGAALLETALIPGLLIGGAAVLAPRYLPRRCRTLGKRGLRGDVAETAKPDPGAGSGETHPALPKFAVGQALQKPSPIASSSRRWISRRTTS